ncbi:MAG: metallophosphoesterase [Magnetococcus sp. WYHC-3]
MILGIISDTHDHIDHIRKAAELFRQAGVDMVLHAGDTGSPASVLAWRGLDFRGVYGNNDGERVGLARAAEKIGGRMDAEFMDLHAGGQRLALYHGYVPALHQALILSGTYDVVVTGHTHRIVDQQEGRVRLLNPGTAHGFGKRATAMVYDTATGQVAILELAPSPAS